VRGLIVVLSIGRLGAGQGAYYLDQVADRPEKYYTGAGEAPGEWRGSAAAALGLVGVVDAEGLRRALAGEHPATGEKLSERAPRTLGFDLTFRAPKSVSLLFALGERTSATRVRDAHEAAVDAALGYLEREACVARRGFGGTERLAGNGFLAAGFRHRLSRAGDPQLHTHVVVANVTRGSDGRWTALDGTALYAQAKTAGFLYQAQLRHELTRRLGVEWAQPHNGVADVAGVDRGLIDAFSRRSREIGAYLDEHPELGEGPRAAQVAALATRRAKESGVSAETLRDEWCELAAAHGVDERGLAALCGGARGVDLDEAALDAVAERLAGPQGLTRQRSSFGRREAIQDWAEQLSAGAPVERVEAVADEFLATRAVVLAGRSCELTERDVIRRADGRVVAAAAGERRYSTPELLALERRALNDATSDRHSASRATEEAVHSALARSQPALSGDQVAVVEAVCLSDSPVQVVVGPPGTGKTFSLAAARRAWEQSGQRVVGAGLSARAADELQSGTGIDSYTIARLLTDLRDPSRSGGLAPGTILVVDEAAMVGSRDLAELLNDASRHGAKVVLVGDDRQLPAIDAGGLFRALELRGRATGTTVCLAENRRQREAWQRQALAVLRDGLAGEALRELEAHGQVHVAEDAI
jgi:conjugative relaxase-like TrwC/TraI family protein